MRQTCNFTVGLKGALDQRDSPLVEDLDKDVPGEGWQHTLSTALGEAFSIPYPALQTMAQGVELLVTGVDPWSVQEKNKNKQTWDATSFTK